MVTTAHLCMESSPKPKLFSQIEYPFPNPTSSMEREEPPFSHLWKGVCDFLTGIFKPCKERHWEEKVRSKDEEIKALKARLESKEVSFDTMERFVGQEMQGGAKLMEKFLTDHAENIHKKRMGELNEVYGLFKRHEIVSVECLRYKQGYEHLAIDYNALQQEYNALKEHDRLVMLQNEQLAAEKIKFENLYIQEREIVAMYERAWYGMGGGGSSS